MGFSFIDHTDGLFPTRLASDEPAPGGGAAAAPSAALSAGLVAMSPRFSSDQIAGRLGLVDVAQEAHLLMRTHPDDLRGPRPGGDVV